MTQVRGTLGKEGSSGLMSAEELKVRLQQHFAKSGTLNNLKTQLRNQLVTELFKVAELPTNKIENEFSDAEAKKTLLPLQVSNWLVYDHLKRQGYDYSLSTFVTEASVSFPEKLLSLRDVLDLLGFKSDSEESETITEHYVHCKHGSFLHSLLLCVMKQHKKHNHNLFDLHCKENKFKDNTVLTTDGNSIAVHQQLYQNGSWSEPQNKEPRLNLLDESQNHLEMHQQKLYQMLQSEKEGQQNEVQRLRQKLLSELDRLYEHEQQVRLELEQRKNRLTREQELLDVEKNKLRAKELELEKHASHIETENEKSYLIKEQHLSASLKKKEEEFAELEDRLRQQEHRLNEERQIFNNQKRELEDLRNQLQQSKKNYQHIQNEYSALLAENAVLKKKMENATDYEHIKIDLLNYLKETESCKMEIKEIKERSEAEKHVLLNTVKNLEEQLRICLQKANSVKDVGISAVTSHFQDESMWNEQKGRLEQELSETKQLYHDVLEKLQEQNEDIQDLHLSIHVLHDEISHPTNKGKHPPKAQDQNSHPVLPPPPISGPDNNRPAQLQRTLSPHTQHQYNAQYSGLFYPSRVVQRTAKEDPYTFISEAKKRIRDLEQEAQAVKEKYSVFVASQMKLPSPSYTAYGNAFHNYDFMSRTNQDYTVPGSKNTLLLSSSLQTAVTDKQDNNHTVPFTRDPYFATSQRNNNAKILTHHGVTDPQDVELVRNSAVPHDHHVQFQNDGRFVSHKINSSGAIPSDCNNPVQKLSTYPGNKENNLPFHVEIRPGHNHPVCSDSTSIAMSHDQFSTLLLDHGEQLLSTANVASSSSESQNTLRHASIDHPFHLSKFGLHSTANKTLTSPLVIAHNQVQPDTNDSKPEIVNHSKQNGFCGESLSQEHPKTSDTSTLNNKSSYLMSANKQSFLEPELSNEQGKRHLCQEQVETQGSNHQTEQLQNVSSEQVDSKNGGLTQNFNVVTGCQDIIKPNKSIEPSRDMKELGGETPPSDIIPNFREVDTSAKMGATKPESNVTLRRLSIDLDSAWRQQESTSLVVKNFMRPRSGSSHSLPSRFNLAGTAAAIELKPDPKPGVKYDDIIEKEVSSPRSHSFSETHVIGDVEKTKHDSPGNSNDVVVRADGVAICEPSEDLRNPHESISSISNQVDVEDVKDLENHENHLSGNLGSIHHTKESDSSEVSEKGEHVSNDSIQQPGGESDHNSSSNIKLLHRDDDEDDEIIASPKGDILVPSELNADVASSDLLHEKNLDLSDKIGRSASEVVSHQDSIKSCENEAGSVKDTMEEEKSTAADVSDGDNYGNEGDLEASVSELSELNLSAGNEELERSKSEESGW